MSHKGNFNVTEMGRIALSLQELIDRQAAEIAGLKEERVRLQKQLGHTQSQLKDSAGKNRKQAEVIKWDLALMDGQGRLINDLHEQLEKRSVLPVFRLMQLFNGK